MLKPVQVLMVEDSPRDAELVVRELRHGGYDPTMERVETASEFTAALDRGGWNVIIADYKLPRFSALEALQIVQDRQIDLPFILVSGVVGEEVAVDAVRAGAHDYVLKDRLSRLPLSITRELDDAARRQATERAERRLTAQQEVTRLLSETVTASATIQETLRALGEGLGWDVGAFWRVDARANVLRCEAFWRGADVQTPVFEAMSRQRVFAVGIGLPGRVWERDEPAWLEDVSLDDNFPRAPAAIRDGLRSGVALPLRYDGQIQGVLEFFRRVAQPRDDQLVGVLTTAAGQLAVHLLRQKEHDHEEAARSFLVEASAVLAESLEYPAILTTVARLITSRLSDWCVVDVAEEDPIINQVAVAHVDPLLAQKAGELAFRPPPDPNALQGVGRVLRTGEPEILSEISDVQQIALALGAAHPDLLLELGAASYLCVPLKARGRVFGAISLFSGSSSRRYTAADLALAEDLARRAAFAIENARLYREARTAIDARDEFLAIASHELRTPISALQLHVQSLLRSAVGGKMPGLDHMIRNLESAERQTRRISQLINNLLDVTRIVGGQLLLDVEKVDLAELVQETAQRFGPEAEHAGCIVNLRLEPAVIGCWDRLRLEQVVSNLMSNAIKYAPGQPIDVSVETGSGRARIIVQDRGAGIDHTQIERVFSRFERVVTTRNVGGLGLGLYISKQIVQAHQVTIRATSQPDAGSTFTIELPMTPLARALEKQEGG